MIRTLAFKALILTLSIGWVISAEKKPKVVSTLLNAKWSRTPFVLEAAEFLASENIEHFWDYLDYFAEPDNTDLDSHLSDEEVYERVITFCSR